MNSKIILISITAFFIVLFQATCSAQQADSFAGTIKINGTIELGDSPQDLVSIFGQPDDTETVFLEMKDENIIRYHYNNGARFDFMNNELLRFTFSSSNYLVNLNSFELKVGNNINTISNSFPNSYSNRGADGTAITLGSADYEYLNIKTNSNGVITEIQLRFIP